MADGGEPRPAQVIAEEAAVAARGDERMLEAARLEDVDAAVDGIALADATEIDLHARVLEAYRVVRLIEQEVAPVHRRQGALDLRLVRVNVVRVIVHVADAGVGDVERPLGDLRKVRRELDEVEQLL